MKLLFPACPRREWCCYCCVHCTTAWPPSHYTADYSAGSCVPAGCRLGIHRDAKMWPCLYLWYDWISLPKLWLPVVTKDSHAVEGLFVIWLQHNSEIRNCRLLYCITKWRHMMRILCFLCFSIGRVPCTPQKGAHRDGATLVPRSLQGAAAVCEREAAGPSIHSLLAWGKGELQNTLPLFDNEVLYESTLQCKFDGVQIWLAVDLCCIFISVRNVFH